MVYYSRYLKKLVFDQLDYFIISILISIKLTQFFIEYFSDQRKSERLCQNLIRKSKLSKRPSKRLTKLSKIKNARVIHFINRGGQQEFPLNMEQILFHSSEEIKRFVFYLLSVLKKREDKNLIINILLATTRGYIYAILKIWGIRPIANVLPNGAIVEIMAGTISGAIIAWYGVGVTFIVNCAGTIMIGRSFGQQVHDELQYRKFRNVLIRVLKDKKVQEALDKIGAVDGIEKVKSRLKLLYSLDFEVNLKLKTAAEGLGLSNQNVDLGPIKSSESYLYKRYRLRKAAEKIVDVMSSSEDIIDVHFVIKNESIKN